VVTNVVGTQTVLDACLRNNIARVVHIGTDEVYGSIDEGSWSESEPLLPNSPYSAAKAAAELLVRSYFVTYGLNVSSTRCSNNYGPYQFPEKLIPLFVTNLIDGKKVPLYGDGLNVRDWLHVDDHCRGIALVIEKGEPGQPYNIGGGLELNNREITERVLASMGADWSMVTPVEDRKGHDRRYSVDDSKLRALGYEPQHKFDDGLAETIAWYTANEVWWRPLQAKAAIK
jgi:dTDP-glucose 4,6-dehydratase